MSKKQSLTMRSLHYYWLATRNHLGLFVALVASTIGFCGFLTYGNPYVMSLIVDRISADPGGSRGRVRRVRPLHRGAHRHQSGGTDLQQASGLHVVEAADRRELRFGHHGLRLFVQPVAVVPFQPLRWHARQPDLEIHGRLHPAASGDELPVFADSLLYHLHVPHPVPGGAGLCRRCSWRCSRCTRSSATSCTSASCI